MSQLKQTFSWDGCFFLFTNVDAAVKFSIWLKVFELRWKKSMCFWMPDSYNIVSVEEGVVMPLAAELDHVPADFRGSAKKRFVDFQIIAKYIRLYP